MRVRLSCLVVALAFLAGCQPEEYAVLISASSQDAVDTLQISAMAMGREPRLVVDDEQTVGRSVDDINGDPIRVAVILDGPTEVMVILRGHTPGGDTLVASRCYRVTGVTEDRVLLVRLNNIIDADGDGFAEMVSSVCADPDPLPTGTVCADDHPYRCGPNPFTDNVYTWDQDCCGTPLDLGCYGHGCTSLEPTACAPECGSGQVCCDGMCITAADPVAVRPGAPETQCADGIDQDCSGVDARCEDADGDGFVGCSPTSEPGTCDCDDTNAAINPGAVESDCDAAVCGDGTDQDCDGRDAQCDRDCDGYPGGDLDCNDGDDTINRGAMELCTPMGSVPVDENCNGLVDELIECAPDDLDRDGIPDCSVSGPPCDCNDCDAGINPDRIDVCGNGVDEDCSGTDATCPPGDGDGDGVVSTASGGTDCDDMNAMIFPGAPERCGDGIAQGCGMDLPCSGDTDGDGYIEAGNCGMDPAVVPWSREDCDGVDQDCDNVTDEVLNRASMSGSGVALPQGATGCVVQNPTVMGCSTEACVVDYLSNLLHCGGCRMSCNAEGGLFVADRCDDARCDCSGEPGTAACPSVEWCCPDGCRNLQIDILNCGGCGGDCNSGRPAFRPKADNCAGATCRCGAGAACADPLMCCGGTCVNPNTDMNNCNACGNVCGTRSQCIGAACQCDSPFENCDDSFSSNGCEIDPRSDLDNCGGCGVLCRRTRATAQCSGFSCSIQRCDAGFDNCDGVDNNGCETPLNTLSDCGSCGSSCSRSNASATCSTGSCRIQSCNSGWGNCDGDDNNGCEQRLTTLTHCGGCGVSCSRTNATATCATESCRIASCNGNWGNCDGTDSNGCETDLRITHDHCSACSNNCGSNSTCMSSACVCTAPYIDCSGDGAGCGTRGDTTSNCRTCGTTCSDGNGCTDDSCSFSSGCVFTNNTASCNDSNACTSGDRCSGGSCSGTAITCSDGNVCTNDSCNPATGCVFTNNTIACNDGSACTMGDQCSGGTCSGTMITCMDGNVCTNDSCNPASGCVFTNNTAACNDGDMCTMADRCSGGSCSGTAISCGDGNPCTDDSCNPGTGCVNTNNTDPCNDGNACTTSDQCSGGSCSGTAVTCSVSGASCVGGSCRCGGAGGDVCTSGECCGSSCVDTDSDPMNCGGCGNACGLNERCGSGVCCCGSGSGNCASSAGSEACTGGSGFCCPGGTSRAGQCRMDLAACS